MRDRPHARFRSSLKEVSAKTILNSIKEGDNVEHDHKIIRGDLDISKLGLKKVDGKYPVSSIIKITNSRIDGSVNFANVRLSDDFDKGVNFSGTVFGLHPTE